MKSFSLSCFLTTTCILSPPTVSSLAASFQGIGDLAGGPIRSLVTDVSGDGSTVVGWSPSVAGRPSPIRWTEANGIEAIGSVPNTFSWALGASHDGSVIVGQRNDLPFVWTQESGFQNMSLPGIVNGLFFGVSGDGLTATGIAFDANGTSEPVRWTAEEGLVNLVLGSNAGGTPRAVSLDGSVIIGDGLPNGTVNAEALRWTEATGAVGLGDLRTSGFGESRGYGVTPDGSAIVGYATTDTVDRHPYLWTEETGMKDLASRGAFASLGGSANDLNADGSIVVGQIDATAFIWTNQTGMAFLNNWLTDVHGLGAELVGWQLTDATGISDDGLTIVGDGINPQGNDEGWVVKLDPVSTLGDHDGDGDVDGQDFLLWQRNPSVGLLADWQSQYGPTSTLTSIQPVPEPPLASVVWVASIVCSASFRSLSRQDGILLREVCHS